MRRLVAAFSHGDLSVRGGLVPASSPEKRPTTSNRKAFERAKTGRGPRVESIMSTPSPKHSALNTSTSRPCDQGRTALDGVLARCRPEANTSTRQPRKTRGGATLRSARLFGWALAEAACGKSGGKAYRKLLPPAAPLETETSPRRRLRKRY